MGRENGFSGLWCWKRSGSGPRVNRLTPTFASAVVVALATGGCALDSRYVTDEYAQVPEPVAEGEIAHRVILVGDAGDAEPGDPVLAEMKRVADELGGARTTIIFLGDNIYPDGMPPKEKQSYDNARSRLEAQIDPAIASGAVTVSSLDGPCAPGVHLPIPPRVGCREERAWS